MEMPLLDALERWDFAGPDAPVFIQSFEVGNLVALREMTHLPLVQLIEAKGQPYDFAAKGDARTYADLLSAEGLKGIARYADVVGVNKTLIIPRTADDTLGEPTSLVADAHAAGLKVHGWTFRAENHFLPREMRTGVVADGGSQDLLADDAARAGPPFVDRVAHGAGRPRAGDHPVGDPLLGRGPRPSRQARRPPRAAHLGFRVPGEVIEYAARLLPVIAPGLEPPTSVRRARGELEIVASRSAVPRSGRSSTVWAPSA